MADHLRAHTRRQLINIRQHSVEGTKIYKTSANPHRYRHIGLPCKGINSTQLAATFSSARWERCHSQRKFVEERVRSLCKDAGRTENEYLARVVEAVIRAGRVINIPDTTGYCLPSEFGAKIKYLR